MNVLRPLIARAVAAIVAAFATWFVSMTGVPLTTDAQTGLADGLTVIGVGFALLAYSAVHKTINRRVNPVDSARPVENVVVRP